MGDHDGGKAPIKPAPTDPRPKPGNPSHDGGPPPGPGKHKKKDDS